VKLFEKDFASKGGTAEKTKFCRDVLKDTSRKDFFRQMAAMTQLAAMVGPEAAGDIAPYLAVHQWRVREHASKRMLDLAKSGASGRLVELFTKAEGANAAALLMALADSGAKEALATARAALKHKDDIVRKAAVQAVMATGGDKAVQEVLAFMASAADVQELWGCELALLSRKDDAAFVKQVRDGAIAMMPKATVAQRRSLAYVMGQLGGAESLTALQKAAATAKDDKDLDAIIEALSYSPDRAADKVLVDLAKQEKQILEAVVAQSVRRMVGPNGVGDVTDSQRLDFAEPILRMMHDGRLISYLGKIHTGRSLQLLVEVMKSGSAPLAAKVIISAVDGMEKQPEAERAIAADALIGVIEYVEVTKLRGGFAAHTKDGDDYVGWKSFQAQAGKAMLKFHKPKAAPIPTFNEKDLDL
jgi:HEAT repeat protein